MKRTYIKLIEGEIQGIKIGIETELILWEHTRVFNCDEYDSDYLIGFGVGFTKGQQIRNQLKKDNLSLSLDEKIKCHNFLFENYDFTSYSELIRHHLEFLNNWAIDIIPTNHANQSLSYLENNQLQRAITIILNHYKFDCYLKPFIEFKKLADQLSSIRFKKRQQKLTTEMYLKEKQHIENELKNWINSKRVKTNEPNESK